MLFGAYMSPACRQIQVRSEGNCFNIYSYVFLPSVAYMLVLVVDKINHHQLVA